MKILKMIFALVLIGLSGYGLLTDTVQSVLPYALFSMALMLAASGVAEFSKRKPIAFTTFLAAGFSLFVGVYTF